MGTADLPTKVHKMIPFTTATEQDPDHELVLS